MLTTRIFHATVWLYTLIQNAIIIIIIIIIMTTITITTTTTTTNIIKEYLSNVYIGSIH